MKCPMCGGILSVTIATQHGVPIQLHLECVPCQQVMAKSEWQRLEKDMRQLPKGDR